MCACVSVLCERAFLAPKLANQQVARQCLMMRSVCVYVCCSHFGDNSSSSRQWQPILAIKETHKHNIDWQDRTGRQLSVQSVQISKQSLLDIICNKRVVHRPITIDI